MLISIQLYVNQKLSVLFDQKILQFLYFSNMCTYRFEIKELNSILLYRETLVQQKQIKVLSLIANECMNYKFFNGVWKIKYNLPRFSIIVYHQNGVLQQPITVEGTHGI